ncbi:MAG: S41 family peptidase [Bacteroidales bacterium]|nr:S41 family peptidase [Bacteroidales bacterium]
MKSIYKILLLLSAVLILGMNACEKDIPPKTQEPEIEDPEEISLFIYEGLKDVYLWYDRVNKLENSYFNTTKDFYTYLNNFGTDYESLFEDLLYARGTVDKWSWIVDDYEELANSFSGISKSMGYDFRLVQIYNSNDIFGYIRYVLPGSPAEDAGLQRGNLFLKVNGQQLTIDNYMELLFNTESYYLTLMTIETTEGGSVIVPGADTEVMNAVELQENPVYYTDVLDVGGVPTGYIVYNAFTSDFDVQLNEAFQDLKDQGVQRLILDLRYNGGGSIQTAIYLASMIYGTDDTKIFAKSEWNDKYNAYIISNYGADYLNYYFTDIIEKIEKDLEGNDIVVTYPINSLGISELYVITSRSTASASELVINGLEPYFDVKLIGKSTTGKYVGSVTVKDYYTRENLNPDHKWAMQPIVLKITNSLGNPVDISAPDYVNGLPPDLEASEDYKNLLPFGDENEPLLKATIDYITGAKSARAKPALVEGVDYKVVADSRDFKPLSKEMYLEGDWWVKDKRGPSVKK